MGITSAPSLRDREREEPGDVQSAPRNIGKSADKSTMNSFSAGTCNEAGPKRTYPSPTARMVRMVSRAIELKSLTENGNKILQLKKGRRVPYWELDSNYRSNYHAALLVHASHLRYKS